MLLVTVVTFSSGFRVSGKQSEAQMKSLKHLISSVIILPSSEGLVSDFCFLNGSPALTAGMRIEQTHFRLSRTHKEKSTRKQPEKQRQLQVKQAKSFSLITEGKRHSGYAPFSTLSSDKDIVQDYYCCKP